MQDFAAALTDMLPLRIRDAGDPAGVTLAQDVRVYETKVIEAIAFLQNLVRGNRIFTDDLGGATPEREDGQQGDLLLDEYGLNLWGWNDGQWQLLANLKGTPGTALLGGAGVPNNASGAIGDWYFQYGIAAWQKVAGTGWVNRFAFGVGTALPDQTGQSGKVLGTNGTVPAWQNPASGLPAQANNAGKFLTTDGTGASWAAGNVGTLSNLLTTVKTSAVAALNELWGLIVNNTSNIGTLANLLTTGKGNLVGAINEVCTKNSPAFSGLAIVGGAVAWDTASKNVDNRSLTLTANVTSLAMSNVANGFSAVLKVRQDTTGGRTLALPAGSVPAALSLGTAPNQLTVLTVQWDGAEYVWLAKIL